MLITKTQKRMVGQAQPGPAQARSGFGLGPGLRPLLAIIRIHAFLLPLDLNIKSLDLIMITEEIFIKEISRFSSISDKLNDNWQFHQPDNTAYPQTPWLSKRLTKLIQTKPSDSPITQIQSEDICEILTQPSQCINGDYHIIFSHVYNVPMLFFNLSHSNGAKLKLDEVWELTRDTDTDKWSFLTEDEHPILCIPYFCLHPCNTGRFMERLLQACRG